MPGSVEFQVFSFTNKIRRLTSHLELHKKIFHRKEVYEDFWENINVCWLICQRKIEYVIRN
jgi:ribosomal protein S15P/S13E